MKINIVHIVSLILILTALCSTTLASAPYTSDNYTKILIHFDNGNGNISFTDVTGRAWTTYGNAVQSTTPAPAYSISTGKFDGVGAYIGTVNDATLSPGTQNFTIEWSGYQNASSVNRYIFGTRDASGTAATTFGVYINAANNIVVTLGNGTSFTTVTSTVTVQNYTWNDYRVVRTGDTVYILQNDTIIGSRNIGTTYNVTSSTQIYTIGRGGAFANNYYNGSIDEFRYSVGIGRNDSVASFTANTTSGDIPLNVQFNDTSIGVPTNWLWNFGDGSTSTTQNATHAYNSYGNFTVSLTAGNAVGNNINTRTNYIITAYIPGIPVASFTANTTTVNGATQIQFTDSSSKTPTSWLWDFGDGTTSTVQNPIHSYGSAGIYTVSLNANNNLGNNTTTQTNYITVTENPVNTLSSDSYTKILLHFNKPGASFLDETGRTWITSGNATKVLTPARYGTSVGKFDGSNSYISTSNISDLSPSSNNFTIEWSMSLNNSTANRYIIGCRDGNGNASVAPIGLYVNTVNQVVLVLGNGTGFTTVTSSTVNFNEWDDYKVVRNGNWVYITQNGIVISERNIGTFTCCNPPTYNMTVGSGGIYPGNYFIGYIDEFKYDVGVANNPPITYYALGDSITLATGGDLGNDGLACYMMQMVHNYRPSAGVDHSLDGSGQQSGWGVTNFASHYNHENFYTVGFGVNDLAQGQDINTTLNNLHTLYNYATSNGSYCVILVQTQPLEDGSTQKNYTYQHNWITAVDNNLTAAGIPHIDMWDAIDLIPNDGIIEHPDPTLLKPDGIHPNMAGQTLMSVKLLQTGIVPPIANFTSSLGYAGKENFTDTSTYYPKSWNWNFGDGESSTLQNPTHVYTQAGTYQVSLNETNSAGSSSIIISNYVVINKTPATLQSTTQDANSGTLSTWGTIVSLIGVMILLGFFYIVNGMINGSISFKQAVPFVTTGGIVVMIVAFVSFVLYIIMSNGGA